MKPVIIIAIAFVLLIPIPVFAQESQKEIIPEFNLSFVLPSEINYEYLIDTDYSEYSDDDFLTPLEFVDVFPPSHTQTSLVICLKKFISLADLEM